MTTEPGRKGSPEGTPKKLWERVKERLSFRKPKEHTPASPPVLDSAVSESKLQNVRDELRRSVDSDSWSNREVSLDSLSIYRAFPSELDALRKMTRAINKMKDEPIESPDLHAAKPKSQVCEAVPMVLSVLANKQNPAIPIRLPTPEEAKAMKDWLPEVSWIIGKFSQNLRQKFDNFVGRKGGDIVVKTGEKAYELIHAIEKIKDPQEQFIRELAKIYNEVATPETQETGDFFGGLFGQEPGVVPVENKVEELLEVMDLVKGGDRNTWINERDYPLLAGILPAIKFPPESLDFGTTSVAGAELMSGIALFLREQGVKGVLPSPVPREVNLFDPSSWTRGLAEWFVPEKLERVRAHLPEVLTDVCYALPPSGPEFAQKLYTVAENATILSRQGKSGQEITDALFRR